MEQILKNLEESMTGKNRSFQIKVLNKLSSLGFLPDSAPLLLENLKNPNCQIFPEIVFNLIPIIPEETLSVLTNLLKDNPQHYSERLTTGIYEKISEVAEECEQENVLSLVENFFEVLGPQPRAIEAVVKLYSLNHFKHSTLLYRFDHELVKNFCIDNYHLFSREYRRNLLKYLEQTGENSLMTIAKIEGRLDQIREAVNEENLDLDKFDDLFTGPHTIDLDYEFSLRKSTPDQSEIIDQNSPNHEDLSKFEIAYQPTQVIFNEGEPGECLFIVKTGTVVIFKDIGSADIIVLNRLGPGEIFGEMALVCGAPRAAGAMAGEDTILYMVNRENFNLIIKNNSSFALTLVRIISSRLKKADERLRKLTRYTKMTMDEVDSLLV